MKKSITVSFSLFFSFQLLAQCVNFSLSSQSDIDNFNQFCTEASTIFIGGNDITNLNGLSNLTKITSLLSISGTLLEDLSGLGNLVQVEGNITLNGLDHLTSLHGLEGLTSVDGTLSISAKDLLNLDGLQNLQYVGVGLIIAGNHSLTNLDGFESLTNIEGYFRINNNYNLKNLNGLENLTSIGGVFEISVNDQLASLSGLDKLESVGLIAAPLSGSLKIANNLKLPSLIGLENIISIGKDLEINGNYKLLSLTGLDNINSIGGEIIIKSNLELSICNLPNLCDLFGQVSLVTISNNKFPCNSLSEVEFLCEDSLGCPSQITLTSQSQIDDFQNIYPNCTNLMGNLTLSPNHTVQNLNGLLQIESIEGDLIIEGSGSSNILLNLEGLENLTHVTGDVDIQYIFSLQSLSGLNKLNYIGGDLNLNDIINLQDLSGFSNLKEIAGSLSISSCNSLQNLQGFDQLKTIGTGLYIWSNSSLTTLTGLEHLGPMIKECYINNNNNLENLNGLEGIAEMVGEFWITGNPSLKSLKGLDQLQSVGEFTIEDNGLINLFGLGNLKVINSMFSIDDNDSLKTLNGLTKLETVKGRFGIVDNNALINLTGLGNLKKIEGNFWIGVSCFPCGNHALENLNGLGSLDSIGGDFVIHDNTSLTTLSGLDNLSFIGGELRIRYNPNLSECSVWPVCHHLSNPLNEYEFYNNANSCASASQILSMCNDNYSRAEGDVYIDLNCNNLNDLGEPLASNLVIKNALNNMPISSTDVTGNYSMFIPPNSTLIFEPFPIYGFSPNPAMHTVSTDGNIQIYSDQDFFLCPAPNSSFINLSVELSGINPPRPGFENSYQICLENKGTAAENAILKFDFSSGSSAIFVEIINPDGGMINGSTVEWVFDNFNIFEPICLMVRISIDASIPLGTFLYPKVTLNPNNLNIDADPSDNSSDLIQEVVGSYDPNDKNVFPKEFGFDNLLGDENLEYIIRFQNTGTSPAIFIEVLDTIEPTLNISTFKMLASSHPYELSLQEDNIIRWFFPNIHLPDSVSNESESHGFVKFSIRPANDLMIDETVSNRAAIYFDFNEPVITNTAMSKIVLVHSTDNSKERVSFNIYPNPTNNQVNVVLKDQASNPFHIAVINSYGQTIYQHEAIIIDSDDFVFNLKINSQPSGLYFIKATVGNKIGVRKLILR